MGLSRNKVAVSEGAAGSPPFYGESGNCLRMVTVFLQEPKMLRELFVVQFPGIIPWKHLNGGVAQLGERLPCKQEVMGSTPTISTMAFCVKTKSHFIWAHSSGG